MATNTSNIGGVVRRRTADHDDAHRSWTSQSGTQFPSDSDKTETRFHPLELPDPARALAAGLLAQRLPDELIDEDWETLPPSANVPVDHPARAKFPDRQVGLSELQSNLQEAHDEVVAQRAPKGSSPAADSE